MADTATSNEVVVTMKDGRKVSFSGKQRMKKDTWIDDGELYTRFDFIHGETYLYVLPKELYGLYALHGASQKLGDSASDCKTAEDMYEAVSSTGDRLKTADDWNAKREGGGFSGAHVIVRALMEFRGRTQEQVRAWIDGKLEATEGLSRKKLYDSLRATEALKPIIARLEAESLSKNKQLGEDLLADA